MNHINDRSEELLEIPENIKRLIEHEKAYQENIGMSEATVLIFPDKVLKIQPIDVESRNEPHIMNWLDGKLSVPKVIAYEEQNDWSFLLMSRVRGKMCCDKEYMEDPELMISLTAKALHTLWNIDITGCPCDWRTDRKLKIARYLVEHDLVDMENAEEGTFGENGFKNPKELLDWLIANKPEEELVLSHGDFCLPNIMVDNGEFSGVIDLGRAGVSDKWNDIAIAYRSIKNNLSGKYDGKTWGNFDKDQFFEKLGVVPDWDKIRYYILLDDLF